MADSAATSRVDAPAIDTTPFRSQQAQRKFWLSILGGVVALGLVGYGIYWFSYAAHFVNTDNAYVGADTAQITPLVDAPVARVLVSETQTVAAGDVLVELDAADARLEVTEARATLASADADLTRTRIDLSRRQELVSGGAVSGDELNAARNAYDAARAARAAAQARLEGAQLALSRMTIRSPIAGIVSDKNVEVGQRVAAGRPLMVIAPIDNAFVDANFKETQLSRVTAGQPVTLHADLYGHDITYHGSVTGIAGGTGAAFSLIPAQNASGNWIKVAQRVPVRIQLDPHELAEHPLRVGMSMTASIDVRTPH
jgi:membrane fusion protein (multidrug efflux system)